MKSEKKIPITYVFSAAERMASTYFDTNISGGEEEKERKKKKKKRYEIRKKNIFVSKTRSFENIDISCGKTKPFLQELFSFFFIMFFREEEEKKIFSRSFLSESWNRSSFYHSHYAIHTTCVGLYRCSKEKENLFFLSRDERQNVFCSKKSASAAQLFLFFVLRGGDFNAGSRSKKKVKIEEEKTKNTKRKENFWGFNDW